MTVKAIIGKSRVTTIRHTNLINSYAKRNNPDY